MEIGPSSSPDVPSLEVDVNVENLGQKFTSISTESHRPLKRRGGTPPFEDDSGRASPVDDRRIVITTEQFVDALLRDQARTDEFFCQDPSCSEVFQSAKDYNAHYMSKHMYKCGTCKKHLPGSHLLELHVLENHDTLFSLMAERKPMYSCVAEECAMKFKTSEERFEHFHTDHKKHDMFGTFQHFQRIHSPPQSQPPENNKSGKQKHGVRQKNKAKSKACPDSVNLPTSTPVEMEVDSSKSVVESKDVDLITNLKIKREENEDEKTMDVEETETIKNSTTETRVKTETGTEEVQAKRPTSPLLKSGSSKKLSPNSKLNANTKMDKSSSKPQPKAVPKITFGHHGQKFKCGPWHATPNPNLNQHQSKNQNILKKDPVEAIDTMDLSSIENVLQDEEAQKQFTTIPTPCNDGN